MTRRPARFTQADVRRALKAVVQSGADMSVRIDLDGNILIARNPNPGPSTAGLTPARKSVL